MKNSKNISVIVLFLTATFVLQAESKFHTFLDFRYSVSIKEQNFLYERQTDPRHMFGNSLLLSELYRFTPKLSAGLGIGIEGYAETPNLGYGSMPIFAVAHYAPFKQDAWYLFADCGYAFETDIFDRGILADIGIGHKLMLMKHLGLNFQLGYNLKQFIVDNNSVWSESGVYSEEKSNKFRHSIAFTVGLIF